MMCLRKTRGCVAVPLRALAVALAALLAHSANALNPAKALTQYLQTSWTSASGLPQDSVHAIAQTADGYLWMGTEEGLARFNGTRFTVFTSRNAHGLASDFVEVLAAGHHRDLWIGTDSGLSHFSPDPRTGEIGAFRAFTQESSFAGRKITALCEDREGALWVGTPQGLSRLFHGRVETWTVQNGLPDLSISAIAMDSEGTIWVGTVKGLARLNGHRFDTLTTRDGLPGNAITALAAAPDGSVWAGTSSSGIAQIRGRQVLVPHQKLPWKEIAALLPDRDGAVWIAFTGHGLGRVYRGKLELYGAGRGLPSDRCSSILFEDREGSLWLGLLDAGVVQLRDGKFSVFGTPEGLSGNYIGNVLQDRDGSMWIGADSNGLNHLLPDGRVELWDQRRGLPGEAVYSLLQTRDGTLWVGYRHGALARIRHGQVTVYRDSEAADGALNALFEDREGNLWVGTSATGLARFAHGRFLPVTQAGDVAAIAQTLDGAVWTAINGEGVQRMLHGTNTVFTTANGLPSNRPLCLYADPEGGIWVGSAGAGLSYIRSGHVVSWTPDQGLPDSNVGSIVPDDHGHLWIGSDAGIYSLSIEELRLSMAEPRRILHPVVYGLSDGLRTRETLYGSMPCAWKTRDGRLWFATINGAAVIDPARIPVNRVVPPVWIEQITFNSHIVPKQDGIRLGPGSGNLNFSFSAPTFVAPESIRFRYRMEGFDRDWVYTDARQSARYTNIPPGRYTFIVEAANSDRIWNQTGASFSFVLRPRLVWTPAAWLFYGIVALLLTWGIISLRTSTLLQRQRDLTRTVADRTSQLEEEKAALESARHELQIQATHDSLTGLFNRAAILEHLEREIARSIREKTPLGIVIADLDHFKKLNDQYGHLCGDDAIREAAERFRSVLRTYDMAGRYGGEEFLVLLPGLDPALAPNRIEQLLDSICCRPFRFAQSDVTLTCSIGLATFRPGIDNRDVRELLSRADTALYVAKNAGRNRASFDVCTLGEPVLHHASD